VLSTAQITSATPLDTNATNNNGEHYKILLLRCQPIWLWDDGEQFHSSCRRSRDLCADSKKQRQRPAYSLNVSEGFPAFPALDPTSFTASQGTYIRYGLVNLASLGKGFSATLSLTLNAPNIAGSLTEQGQLSSSTSDPNTSTHCERGHDGALSCHVSGTKTKSGGTLVGSTVTYTVYFRTAYLRPTG